MSKDETLRSKQLTKWQNGRFGMFIHLGLYSACNLDCWTLYNTGTPIEEYIKANEPGFTGKKFDAPAIAAMARKSGCKYIVMGARHHEGYCLWDTDTTDFSSAKMTPKRDFIAEFVKAARNEGLMTGLYYSLLDWRFKAYWQGPRNNPDGWQRLVDYIHNQVKELMSSYGKLDILWYDGAWRAMAESPQNPDPLWGFNPTDAEYARIWKSRKLNNMVRRLQPGILINNRAFLPEDFGTPEKTIVPMERSWEFCDTMGFYWGYSSEDKDRKSTRTLIDRLIFCVSRGGNMILNVGPKPDGTIPAWQKQRMDGIGEWLDKHGEAIYGCKDEMQMPFAQGLAPWYTTRKGNHLYLHLLRYPGTQFGISNIHNYRLLEAYLIDTGKKLTIEHQPTRDMIKGLPAKSPDKIAPVVKIRFKPKTAAQKRNRKFIGFEF